MFKNLKINAELLLITLSALALRLFNLGKLNLWQDEGYSVGYAYRGLTFIFRESFTAEPNPPLYNLCLTLWIKIFGESEFVLRLPSAIFGALSISLVYLIGKKYVSRRVGILSAILIIGNPFYLEYSQEARVYSFFSFICLCSVYYFPLHFEWKDKKKYIAASLLVPWAHAYGVFLLLAQSIYVFLSFFSNKCGKEFIKSWIRIQGAIFLIASIWYIPFFLNKEKYMRRLNWIRPISLNEFFELLKSYIGEKTFAFEALLLTSLAIVIWMLIKKKNIKNTGVAFLFLWLLFTLVIPLIAGHYWQPFLMRRYTIAASMVFSIIVLAPFDIFLKESKKLFATLVLLAALFNVWEVQNYFKSARKQEWEKVLNTILLNDKTQISIAMEEYYEGSSLEYYVRKMGLEKKITIYYLSDVNQLEAILKNKTQVWFIHAENLKLREYDRHLSKESFSHPNDLLQLIKLKAE